MTGFIVSAINKGEEGLYYVSNTSPILWSKDIKEAKIFYSYQNAKNDLYENFISLSATIQYTDIIAVFISEYVDNIEIRRDKFL